MLESSRDIGGILETIRLYELGHSGPDYGMLEQAFHPQASVVGHYEGELMIARRDDYLDILRNDPEPEQEDGHPGLHVRSLDIIGDTAVATVESTMVGTKFTSHLSMIRTGARWKIVNGLFHAGPKPNNP